MMKLDYVFKIIDTIIGSIVNTIEKEALCDRFKKEEDLQLDIL